MKQTRTVKNIVFFKNIAKKKNFTKENVVTHVLQKVGFFLHVENVSADVHCFVYTIDQSGAQR